MNEALLAPCRFCDAADQGRVCASCGRDRTANRRTCPSCGRLTPSVETTCCHCGAVRKSELRWKVPAIIAMFAAAIAAGIAIQIGFD